MTPNSCSFRACAPEPANPWIQPYKLQKYSYRIEYTDTRIFNTNTAGVGHHIKVIVQITILLLYCKVNNISCTGASQLQFNKIIIGLRLPPLLRDIKWYFMKFVRTKTKKKSITLPLRALYWYSKLIVINKILLYCRILQHFTERVSVATVWFRHMYVRYYEWSLVLVLRTVLNYNKRTTNLSFTFYFLT